MKEETTAPVTVCDVQFRSATKFYYFDPNGLDVRTGDTVIVDTAYGLEIGQCVHGNHDVEPKDVVAPLRRVRRLATENDKKIDAANRTREKNAFATCQKQIEELHMDMQLVSAEYAFDGSKVLFFFTADGRVDFRELVKHLASTLRTRIELRQIGVRDKAKMVGGLGICGRPFCCRQFLDDFQPVSIKMAKTQNLSLNPTKISGVCGRLMCCLKYEQDAYEDLLRTAPKNESFVDTPDGRGTITDVNLLRQSVKVRMEDHPETIGTYKNCDICVLRSGKARKNDPPIPKDLAPISSRPRPAVKPVEEFEPLPEVIYPDQVSEFDQQSAFGAQNELLSGREISLTPGEADKPEAGDKPAGQNRRRRRARCAPRAGKRRRQVWDQMPMSCFFSSFAAPAPDAKLLLNLSVLAIAFLNVLFPAIIARNIATAFAALVSQSINVLRIGITALSIGANAAPHEPFSPCKEAFSSLMLFCVSGSFSA